MKRKIIEKVKETKENIVEDVISPFVDFVKIEAFGGVLLIAATALALVWANSPWADSYEALWNLKLGASIGEYSLRKPLILWINDGLMAMFFFVVGLEIKREVVMGELSSLKKAGFPFAAALGGMVVPAAIYLFINYGKPGAEGWGVPMATDIAFSLGLLTLLGSRVPISLKILLTAIAVVDDIGAVLVIAFFYSSDIIFIDILIGAAFLGTMLVMSVLGVRNPWVYAILGIGGVWLAFLLSGVHATVAGILAAFVIPVGRKIDTGVFLNKLKKLALIFEKEAHLSDKISGKKQLETVMSIKSSCNAVSSPLLRLESRMHPWVTYFIMPVFALSNAGVEFSGEITDLALHPVSLGVFAGLLLGKIIGIFSFSWIAVKLRITELPGGVNWSQHFGITLLAGVGFTMSLFIAGLAFRDNDMLAASKLGIFAASLVAGVGGLIWVKQAIRNKV